MSNVTTYTNCLRIERTDGFVICLTELDKDLYINDQELEGTWGNIVQTYLSAAGYTPTNMQSTSDNAVNNADVEGVLTSIGVNREDIIGGRYDFAKLHIFIYDWENNVLIKRLGSGHWGEVTIKDGSYVAEFRSLSQQLQQTIGRTYNPECDEQLGGPRCTINIALFTDIGVIIDVPTDNQNFNTITQSTNLVSQGLSKIDDIYNYGKLLFTGTKLDLFNGKVTSVTSTTIFDDTSMTEPSNTRDNRRVNFITGLNAGESQAIVSQLGNRIVINAAFTFPIAIDDEYYYVQQL